MFDKIRKWYATRRYSKVERIVIVFDVRLAYKLSVHDLFLCKHYLETEFLKLEGNVLYLKYVDVDIVEKER